MSIFVFFLGLDDFKSSVVMFGFVFVLFLVLKILIDFISIDIIYVMMVSIVKIRVIIYCNNF